MEINTNDTATACVEAIKAKVNNLKKLNIIVVGKSGVGKSTLINSLFSGNFAETGIGRPVTSEIRKIEKQDYPMAIYDTPGFELSKDQQTKVKDEIIDLINKGIFSRDINEAIHCIWYCVNVNGNRTFDETEIAWLNELTENNKNARVPIIIVLTQAFIKNKALEMKKLIEKENLDIVKVVPVLAQDIEFDEGHTVKAYGLDRLVDVMSASLPTELLNTLQYIQKASLEAKKRYAQTAIATAAAAAAATAASPIPFSDAAALVPIQITMIATITTAFGLKVDKSIITGFVSSTIGTAGTTVLGKTIVANLIKLIAGPGTVAGGVISSATAVALTVALGEAYIKVMELVYTGDIKSEDMYSKKGQSLMETIFKKELSKNRKKE